MNKCFATLLLFLIIQFTERFNFAADCPTNQKNNCQKSAAEMFRIRRNITSNNLAGIYWHNEIILGCYLEIYLDFLERIIERKNSDLINYYIQQPDINPIEHAVNPKFNSSKITEFQIKILNLWTKNKAVFLLERNYFGLDQSTCNTPDDYSKFNLKTYNPVLVAAYFKNFKLAELLLKSHPISFSSTISNHNFDNQFYLQTLILSDTSAYDLEFFLKNNVEIPEEYESLETVKIARESIKRRELIQRIAATQRKKEQPSFPYLVQKNISDFLQSKNYHHFIHQKYNHVKYLEKIKTEKKPENVSESEFVNKPIPSIYEKNSKECTPQKTSKEKPKGCCTIS